MCLFLATPHEFSRELVPEAIGRGFRVIDLSGAWRLKNAGNRAVYGFEDADAKSAAKLDAAAVYGLPELHADEIKGAPLAGESRMLSDVDHSGAGAVDSQPATSTWRTASSAIRSRAYREQGSRQRRRRTSSKWMETLRRTACLDTGTPARCWSSLGLNGGSLQFTPHLLPIPRGILSTIYVKLAKPATAEELEQSLREFYAGKPWVRIFGAARLPQIKFSLNTNYCDIGFSLSPDGTRAVLVSCIDNLLKGAAGQAVQNMNLMFGFDEKEGLQ